MTTASHADETPRQRPRAFPPASKLHAQVEEQARELHELRARLGVALDELGSLTPPLHAPSPGPLRKGAYLAPATRLEQTVTEGEAWWPTSAGMDPPLRPAPGHRCAGLIDDDVPVMLVSLCGTPADATAATLERIVEQQMATRAFVPLFVTDDAAQLHLFRHQGYDVELLPRRAALEACPGAIDAEEFLTRRVARIVDAWGIARCVDMGTSPLSLRRATARPPEPRATLVFYKDYRRYNPYQHLLYVSLPRFRAVAGDVEAAIDAARAGPTFFHVNWEEAVYRGARSRREAQSLVTAFLDRLDVFAAGGGRIVWTLHNSEPHDNPFAETYARLAGGIAERSALVLVHSGAAASLVKERCAVPEERLCMVPHGGYHALYGRPPDRAAARRSLGLPEQPTIFGFVGNVRPYKNVPLLIDAFTRLERGSACLLVAGKQQPPLDLAGLDPELRDAIVVRDEVIGETELPRYLAACDAIVLPYARILTSGSLMLALSLEVPVIVPAVPSLLEVVDDGENGLVFAPDDAVALAQRMAALRDMSEPELRAMRRAAGQTARLCDWGWIGRRVAARLGAVLEGDQAAASGDQGSLATTVPTSVATTVP